VTLPVRPVSVESLAKISAALEELATRPDLTRTKRTIERLSGLGHDIVARAFRQDLETGTEHRLNERLAALTAEDGRQSPQQLALREAKQKLAKRNATIAGLQRDLAAMAQVVLAQHRLLEESKPNPVVRIDRGRGDRPDKQR
jgi:hypothetical protein